MGYIVISGITLILSFILFRRASGTMSFSQLNLISFNYYYQLIIQAFVGVNIVILGLDNHYLLNRITSYSIKQEAYFSVVFVLLALPLSMLLVSFIFRFNGKVEWENYRNKEIGNIISFDDKSVFITIIIFTFLSFLSIAYTFINVGTIPIFHLFSGTTSGEAARLRIIASREFEGIVYIRNIFGLTLTPILSYIAYAYSIKSKYKGWKIIFWCLFALSLLILTYSLAKAPVLMYILSFIFLQVLVKGKVNTRIILKYFSIVLILIFVFYNLLGVGQISFFDFNSGPLGRILLGQISSLYFHYLYFPDVIPFLDGRSFPAFFIELFGIENVRSARLVMELVNPTGIETGTAGVMNTLFIAEIYANYGWLGVIFGTVYVGFYIQLFYIFFLRFKKNPITIALFTYFTYKLPLTGGFFDFVYNPGLITVVLLMLIFYLVSNMLHKMFVYKKPKSSGIHKGGIKYG